MARVFRYGQMELALIHPKIALSHGSGMTMAEFTQRGVGPNPHLLKYLEQGQQWWSRLERSIRDEGLRNPILTVSVKEGVFMRYGGSRFYTCKKLGLERVPAVVLDFVGRFEHWRELETEDDIRSVYTDRPETILMDEGQILHCPHSHLPGSPNPGKLMHDKYKLLHAAKAAQKKTR